MSNTLIIICYCLAAYGLSNMMVFGSGPFRLFERIRAIANYISEHLGSMFSCMMCFPANVGLFCSLINWFLIPAIQLTPFNIILHAHSGLWWLAALCDCAFTSGVVWLLNNVSELLEKKAEEGQNIIYEDVKADDSIEAEDITLKRK